MPISAGTDVERMMYVLQAGDRGMATCHFRCPGLRHARASSLRRKSGLQSLLKGGFLTSQDRRILMRIYMAALPGDDTDIELSGKQGYEILQEIVDTGRCVWEEREEAMAWSEENVRAILAWRLTGSETQMPVIESEEGRYIMLATSPLTAVDKVENRVVEVECGYPASLAGEWLQHGEMNGETASDFLHSLGQKYPDYNAPSPPTVERRAVKDVQPVPFFNIRQREFFPRKPGSSVVVYVGELWFEYKGQRVRYGSSREVITVVENELIEIGRDRDFEKGEAKWLEGLGFTTLAKALRGFELEDARHDFVGRANQHDPWYEFLAQSKEDLEARGWIFRYEGTRQIVAAKPGQEYCSIEASGRKGWFDFEAGIEVDGKPVNLLPLIHDLLKRYHGKKPEEIREAVSSQVFFVPTVSGQTHVFEGSRFFSMVERIFELYDRDPFPSGEHLRVSALRAAELADSFHHDECVEGISEALRKVAAVLRDGIAIESMDEPDGLQAKLRDYQKTGLGWLQFLSRHEVNGILADDMGLGKTLQTISHLVAEKNAGRLEKPALLVAPTSLMKNWRDEVMKFAPHLNVVTLHGNDRVILFRTFDTVDIVLTTYGLIRRDAARHLEQDYSWVILDEAQFIKNPKSRVTEVLGRLKSDRRLCLSGTPLENHLGELWSLFHFLMPGFLGDADVFKRQFRIPIELDGNEAMQQILMRRVRPFLLRRKKVEVAKELPPKTIIDHPVEMEERQRDIYESVRVAMHKRVQSEIAERGLARSQIVILDAITKLRQICCDPRLAKLGEKGLGVKDSAKLKELMELLPDMISDGRKVLVFSQFTSMLALIERELDSAEMDYVTLTGSTKNRGKCVDDFQSGKVPLFLISLRAGGTGLNLTRADTVIHYDPWWNPAVEAQATDRAHRIGQKQSVFVYKMVSENSVEEKIIELQKKKAALAEGILSGSGKAKLKFDETDVASLLGED